MSSAITTSKRAWHKVWDFFAQPFGERDFPQVPWKPKDAIVVVLVSTLLFSVLIFGGFFVGAEIVDKGWVETPKLLEDLGLEMTTKEAIELDIIDGFAVMSLLLYENISIAIIAGIFLQVFLQVFLLYAYSRFKYGVQMTAFGFRALPVRMLLVMVVLLFVLSVLIQNGVLAFYAFMGIEDAAGNGGAEQMITQGAVPLPVLFIFAGIVAPILEEVIFRGFFLAGSLQKSRAITALVYSAIFFAIAHLNPSLFFASPEEGMALTLPSIAELGSAMILMPIYFLLGILLGFSFLKTRSLYPGIVFHMVNNTAALMLLLNSLKHAS